MKIYALSKDGASFENTRWLFDWDDNPNIAPIDNLVPAIAELDILKRLQVQDIIKLRVEDNPASPNRTKYRDLQDYQISKTTFYKPGLDKAYSYLEWCVWITSLDYPKFLSICQEKGFIPSTGATDGILTIENYQTPAVNISGKSYVMKPLRTGLAPEQIVSYCLNVRPGKKVNLSELKEACQLNGVSNLKQVLINTQFGGKHSVLSPFITLTPKSVQLVSITSLSTDQQDSIISASLA